MNEILKLLTSLEKQFNAKNNNPLISFNVESGFAVQQLQRNEMLTNIALGDMPSLRNAFLNVAAIGISLNPALSEAFLVPRDKQVVLDISYQGLISLATRSGAIQWVQAEVVYENDDYTHKGPTEKPIHNYNPFDQKNRGSKIGVYCIAKLPDSSFLVSAMSFQEVSDIRSASRSANSTYSPWNKFESEMWKKCVIKRAYKTWPKVTGLEYFQEAIGLLNEHDGIKFNQPFTQDQYEEFQNAMTNPLSFYILEETLRKDDVETWLAMHKKYIGGIERGNKKITRDKLISIHDEGKEIADSIIEGLLEAETRQETLDELTAREKTFFSDDIHSNES